jgi:hypothetical protein
MDVFFRHEISDVADRLTSFAEEAGLAGEPETYVVADETLVAEREVVRDAAMVMRILNRHRRMIRIQLPFAAGRIHLGANARVFGLKTRRNATAKVRLENSPQRSFTRECTARRVIARNIATRALAIPRVLKRGRGGQWFIEEFVRGKDGTIADLEEFLARHAHEFYRATARARPLVRPGRSPRPIRELRGMLAALSPALADFPDDAAWPVAIGHGDLHYSNFLRGEDQRLWMVDFEWSAVLPVAVEFGPVFVHHPELRDRLMGLLDALGPGDGRMPPARQMAIAAMHELRQRDHERSGAIRASVESRQLSAKQAAAVHDEKSDEVRGAIAELASRL